MYNVQNESAMRIKRILDSTEEVKNTRNDVNNWVKEVKYLEEKLHIEEDDDYTKPQPIRSHTLKDEPVVLRNKSTYPQNKRKLEIEEEQQNRMDKAEIFKNRGNNHVKFGDYDKAILEYTAAINAYDEDPKFFTNRALCYLKLNKCSECIDDCDSAITLDKLNVKAYYRRMQANETLCLYTQALKDCTTVLMIDSNNREAKESLQRINQRLKKTGAVPKGYQTTKPSVIKEGPQFSPLRSNMMDIFPATKLPSSISKKPLKTIPIIDVVGPKDGKNYENSNVQISDEAIDKLFNGECGSYEEIKKTDGIKVKALEKDCNKVLKEKNVLKTTKGSTKQAEMALPIKKKPLPPAPTTPAQFYCNWKDLSAEQKYHYLKSIPVQRLNKILGASLDSDTLTDMLSIFKEFYVGNKDDKLCETLLEFCKHERLKILTLMLSPDDKDALSDALNFIKNKTSAENLNLIKKSFNFK